MTTTGSGSPAVEVVVWRSQPCSTHLSSHHSVTLTLTTNHSHTQEDTEKNYPKMPPKCPTMDPAQLSFLRRAEMSQVSGFEAMKVADGPTPVSCKITYSRYHGTIQLILERNYLFEIFSSEECSGLLYVIQCT